MQKLAMHILIHKYYCNLLHMFEPIVQLLLGIILHKILIFCQHMSLQGMSLHIVLYYCLQIAFEWVDNQVHKFSSMDLHSKVRNIFRHKMQFVYKQNSQLGNI
jgi:hypothetical protein